MGSMVFSQDVMNTDKWRFIVKLVTHPDRDDDDSAKSDQLRGDVENPYFIFLEIFFAHNYQN